MLRKINRVHFTSLWLLASLSAPQHDWFKSKSFRDRYVIVDLQEFRQFCSLRYQLKAVLTQNLCNYTYIFLLRLSLVIHLHNTTAQHANWGCQNQTLKASVWVK